MNEWPKHPAWQHPERQRQETEWHAAGWFGALAAGLWLVWLPAGMFFAVLCVYATVNAIVMRSAPERELRQIISQARLAQEEEEENKDE